MGVIQKPTVGRIVLFHEIGAQSGVSRPMPAIISEVWSDSCVNLAIFRTSGSPMLSPPTSIPLIQADEAPPAGVSCFCQWPRVETCCA